VMKPVHAMGETAMFGPRVYVEGVAEQHICNYARNGAEDVCSLLIWLLS
jgi:hypothetical protein